MASRNGIANRGVLVDRNVPSDEVMSSLYTKSSFLCPNCLRSVRPTLSHILKLLVDLKELGVLLPEGVVLQSLTNRAIQWLDSVRKILAEEELAFIVARVNTDNGKQSLEITADTRGIFISSK